MITVAIDLSDASPVEEALFYQLPGVGRALDSLIAEGRRLGVKLQVAGAPAAPAPGFDGFGAAVR